MKSTFKRKLTSLLLIAVMLVSLCPMAAFANDTTSESISVTVSYQADGWFNLAPQEITVSSNTAESYGFELDSSADVVTTLDVLVAANIAYADSFGQKFSPATITTDKDGNTTYTNGFLTIKNTTYGASIYEMFDKESTNCSFTVNGATPHDDVYNDEWKSYTGYTISQATVKDGDNVEFFFYQDSYAMDKYAFFTDENGNRLSKLYLCPNENATLTLQGYPIGWYSCSTDEVIADHTAELSNCSLILVDATATPIYEGDLAEIILATATDSNGSCTISFPENGTYYLTTTEPENDHAILPWLEIEVGAFEKATEPNYENKVYADFENDIWLQYDFKELTVGDTATIFPRRMPQIDESEMGSTNGEYYCRPNFNFNIIAGDSIKLNTNDSKTDATVTAVKPGDSIVMVSYDAVTDENKDITYDACSEVNYAYVVYSVGDEDTPEITISTDIPYSSYDTLYYADGEGYTLDFKVTAEGADSITVMVNGEEITSDQKDVYHALLTNRSNIIGIIATDKNDNTKSYYQVIDARKIEITVENGLDAARPLTSNEEVNISFKGITMPIYKIEKIYNPSFIAWGGKGTYVHYTNTDLGGELTGYCNQYDLAQTNTITFTPSVGGQYTLTNGRIFTSWWGKELGTDKGEYNPNTGLAPVYEGEFSILPDITLDIAYDSDAVRVNGITLDKTTATLKVGDTLELLATVAPSNATNKDITWSLINTKTNDVESYYATIDQNGKITALNPTPSGTTLVATATTADGNYTASCTFSVKGTSATINKNKVNISIDTYTVNNQSIIDLTAINYQDGDTVWSATKRLLDDKGITYTYNSKKTGYVSEINGIKELDYGAESGWMYSVNGDYPDTGCGDYEISAGDTIRWRYTLNLGKDLGVTLPEEAEKPSTGGSTGGAGGTAATKPTTENNKNTTTTETAPTAPIFSDVPANAWYYTTVTNIATKGLMTGTAANTFEPNKVTTRAELVAILYRLQNNPAIYGDSKFADVSADAWYANPVIWAENMHIISGVDAEHFAPNEALTREQVVAILMNYAKAYGYDTTLGGMAIREYADYDSISAYALPSMNWAVASGIIKGKDGNTLDPQGTATRAEIATMLERFIAFYEIY